MSTKRILVSYGVDFGTAAGRPGAAGRGFPPGLSQALFTGEVAVPRLLTLFERFEIETTWFVTAAAIEAFPDEARMVVEAGHELALLGETREHPPAVDRAQQEQALEHAIAAIETLAGTAPRGHRAPAAALPASIAGLLLERGIVYDHSLVHDDVHPCYLSAGCRTPPGEHADASALVEIPYNRDLDDRAWLPGEHQGSGTPQGFSARAVEAAWRDVFDWVYRECDDAVLAFTVHPELSGRPQALLMHERLFEYISGHAGVRFVSMNAIATDFAHRGPPRPE